ncbi:hypothetical protein J7L87_04035 [bacterium]|nr:hypothetical protein [bacterium]
MENTIFYLPENRHIENPEIVKKEIEDIKSKSFQDILLQIRDTAFQIDDPSVIETLKKGVRNSVVPVVSSKNLYKIKIR